MEKVLKILSSVILLIIGLSAIGGGLMLIIDPSGDSMQFPIDLLSSTPFSNYLIPGIILFMFIGVVSLIVAGITINDATGAPIFIIIQGFIIMIWLTVELILNVEFYMPSYHLPLYGASMILIGIGLILIKGNTFENNESYKY